VAEREPAVSPTPVERSPAEDPKLEELRREAILLDVVADFDVVNYSAEELRVRIERAEDSVEHEECGDLVAVGDDSDDSFSVLADSIGLELSRLDIPQLPPAAMKDKIEYLGKGAFEVYLYTADLSSLGGSSDARVAAKFLPLLEEATDSIVAEARASWIAASVSSHVPRMHAVVVCDDDVVILMEHVSGETLKSIIARRTKFFLDDVTALAFASDLTAAVAALHGGSFGGGERLAHRDLKPGNIMIAGDLRVAAATGPRPRVRAMLIDLGEAKIIDGADPHTIRATGTARYMAPEVVEVMTSTGSYNALSADMWSLGIVLLELVAAASKKSREFRGLFVGGSGAEVEKLDAVMEACDVTPAWASLIKACVSSTPENRPTATYVHDKVLEMFGSERDALAIREIEMYLEFRVQDSRTIYSVGRRCRELVDWGRVELMTDYIQRGALVKKFTERQRLAFHEVVDSGEFIYSITTDGGFEQLLLPSVTASTTHVVYLAQHRGSRKGYVGLTNRTLKKRMGEHFARDGTAADRAMTNRDEWRWGVLGVFENTAELDWIEVFFTLLFNTFITRSTGIAMGYNTDLGGRPGVTKRATEGNQ
jgi:serine/threonine protein kinase